MAASFTKQYLRAFPEFAEWLKSNDFLKTLEGLQYPSLDFGNIDSRTNKRIIGVLEYCAQERIEQGHEAGSYLCIQLKTSLDIVEDEFSAQERIIKAINMSNASIGTTTLINALETNVLDPILEAAGNSSNWPQLRVFLRVIWIDKIIKELKNVK